MDQKFWNTLLDRTSNALAQAAKVLGQATEHVYEVLVRQQVVEGIGALSEITFLVIVLTVLWKTLFKKYWLWVVEKEKKATRGDQGMYVGGAIFVTIGAVIMVALGANYLGEAIKHILNPEFYAISYIFSQVQQATGGGGN